MGYCKKFRAVQPGAYGVNHRRRSGSCQDCAYFSMKNCGVHQNADGMAAFCVTDTGAALF